MSKIVRYQGNVRAFASDAQGMERTVFGGKNQADDLTSQITESFLRGWGIVGASEHPSLEDFNAAMYALSQFIAYQHQMGVPEWHAEQEYRIGSICTYNGESYQSLQNANIGSQPPSAKWTPVLTSKNGLENLGLEEGSALPVGVPVPWPSATPPDGWLKCNGAAFDKANYPKLAVAYPSGNLPDLRGVFIRGLDDGRNLDPGRTVLSLAHDTLRKHTHAVLFGDGAGYETPAIHEKFRSSASSVYMAVSGSSGVYISESGGSETAPVNLAFTYIVRAA